MLVLIMLSTLPERSNSIPVEAKSKWISVGSVGRSVELADAGLGNVMKIIMKRMKRRARNYNKKSGGAKKKNEKVNSKTTPKPDGDRNGLSKFSDRYRFPDPYGGWLEY